MIARRIRDIVRGLTGAYLIEGRLGELGEAIRSLSPPANLDSRLGDLDAGLGDLNARFEDLDSRLTLVETRLRRLDNLTAHAVVRDVGIAEYMGFPSYFYRDDMAFRANIAAGPSPTVDMTLEAAQNSITRRMNNRKRMTPQYLIATYWTIFNKHDYNEIHKPLIAILHETGCASDFVDVGANVGDTAMSAAEAIEMLGLDTHVHSFEPGPIFDLARANFALNRLDERISVHNVAASDAGGYLPMQIMVGHAESGSIGGISAHYDIPVGETRFVRAARLDAFLPNDGRSYFIKIDAEGVDFAVVRGAAGLIASGRAPILTLEFTPKYNSPADMDTARRLMTDYTMFSLRGLDHAGHFDCFDPVSAEGFDTWVAAVAASPHGWTDVAYVSRGLLDTAPMSSFLSGYKHYAQIRNATSSDPKCDDLCA